jgi:hypothetical protein
MLKLISDSLLSSFLTKIAGSSDRAPNLIRVFTPSSKALTGRIAGLPQYQYARFFGRSAAAWAALVLFVSSVPAAAQSPAPPVQGTTTTLPALTLADTVIQMVRPVGAPHIGEAFGLATQLEVATAPFGASSGGFVIKLDPSTGLQVRTATTFGPSFAERALTSGEGNISVGVNFMSSSYDRLDNLAFDGLQVRSVSATSPRDARSGRSNMTLSSTTAVISARMGVSDKLDIGAYIPIVTVKVGGTTTLQNGNGDILTFAKGSGVAKGLGDIAGLRVRLGPCPTSSIQSTSNTTDVCTDGIPNHRCDTAVSTTSCVADRSRTRKRSRSTDRYGSTATARFPQEATSIISTSIRSTTIRRTSHASRARNTDACTGRPYRKSKQSPISPASAKHQNVRTRYCARAKH